MMVDEVEGGRRTGGGFKVGSVMDTVSLKSWQAPRGKGGALPGSASALDSLGNFIRKSYGCDAKFLHEHARDVFQSKKIINIEQEAEGEAGRGSG